MNGFKIGDKVMCIDDKSSGRLLKLGRFYTVKSLDSWGHIGLSEQEVSEIGWKPTRFELVEKYTKIEFQVGDIVEWCGVRGAVVFIDDEDNSNSHVRMKVTFDLTPGSTYQHQVWFTTDGRWANWQQPSLKLIERPKKKKLVNKKISRWVNIYSDGKLFADHLTKEDADASQRSDKSRIACVELTGEYEVEVEAEDGH